jgi:hypothetical protein
MDDIILDIIIFVIVLLAFRIGQAHELAEWQPDKTWKEEVFLTAVPFLPWLTLTFLLLT